MSTVTGKCVHDLNNNELHIVYINICKAWVPVRAGQSSNKLKNSIIPYKELYSKTTFRRRHLSYFSNQSAHSNFIIDQWHSSRQIRQGLHFQLSSFQRYIIHYSAFVAYNVSMIFAVQSSKNSSIDILLKDCAKKRLKSRFDVSRHSSFDEAMKTRQSCHIIEQVGKDYFCDCQTT